MNPLNRCVRVSVVGLMVACGCSVAVAQTTAPRDPQADRPRQDRQGDRRPGVGAGLGRMGGDRSVTKADLDTYAKILNLDETQKEAANLLLEAHQQEVANHQESMRQRFDDLRRAAREDGESPDWSKLAGQMQSARAERQRLEASFMNELKAVLTPAQAEKWGIVEQTRRREKTMGSGLLAGERLDVIRAVGRLQLDPGVMKDVQPVLDQYAGDLDRELVARNQLTEAAQAGAAETLATMDMAKIGKSWEEIRSASMRVRDLNRRYARQIEPMLPEDKRAEFTEQARRESYPLIYRPGPAGRTFETVGRLSDLTDEQKTTLKTLRESFDRELGALQKQMESAYDEREASIRPEEVVAAMTGGGGGGFGGGRLQSLLDTERMQELREQRRTVETAAVEKIRAVLTPEQRERIESQTERRGGQAEGDRPRRQRGEGRRQREVDPASQPQRQS